VYLLGRARSLRGYKKELADAGFRTEHRSIFGRSKCDVAFVLSKEVCLPNATCS
jgi:hypothetical protein